MSVQLQLVSVFEELQQKHPWAVQEHVFLPKQDILLEDDDDDDVYLIRKGKAAVILSGGSEILLRAGDLIGELSFLLGNKRTASIVAKEDVVCWSMHIEDMEKIFSADSALSAKFYKSLGKVIAERLVNGAKIQAQNVLFQEEEEPLIGIMTVQSYELKQKFENLVRIILRQLKEETKEKFQALQEVHREYGRQSSSQMWEIRREKIAIIMDDIVAIQTDIFARNKDKMLKVFADISHMLGELLDLEKRNEVGKIAYRLFDQTLLSQVSLWEKRKMSHQAQVEPILLIAHILQKNTGDMHSVSDPKMLIIDWIDDLFQNFSTIIAFRERINLLSETVTSILNTAEENPRIVIVNDIAGVILAKVYPQAAKLSGNIYGVSHDESSLYYMDMGMDIRSGRVKMRFHRIASILSLILGDSNILPPNVALYSQNVIAIDGLMDYLPDRYLVRLVEKSLPYLADGGKLILSALLPSDDQVLFSNFFQWHCVRRSTEEVCEIFSLLEVSIKIEERNGAMVVIIEK